MDMEQLYSYVPRELVTFVLVTLFSLLIGLSQRRISLKREGGNYSFRNRPHFYLYWYTGLLALYLRPYGYASVYGRWSGIGIAVGTPIKYYVKQSQFHVFGVTTIIIALITYCMAPIVATHLCLCYGSCDCASAD